MSRVVFRISAGFLVGALAFLATALYLSEYYLDEERRLAAAGDWRGAAEAARTAARLDPFDPEPLEGLSFSLQQQGHNEEAADALRKAIERDPNNYLLHLMLGNLQMVKLDDPDAAAESYRRALDLNPNEAATSGGLAQALIRKGDLEGAKREYEKLMREGGISYQGLYNLGRIYVRTGEPEKGYRTIKLAQRKASADLESLEGPLKTQRKEFIESMDLVLADALVVQGKYVQARKILARSSAEQAPALLQLLNSDPEAYRESVVSGEIY